MKFSFDEAPKEERGDLDLGKLDQDLEEISRIGESAFNGDFNPEEIDQEMKSRVEGK